MSEVALAMKKAPFKPPTGFGDSICIYKSVA